MPRRFQGRPRLVAPIVSKKIFFQTGQTIIGGTKTEILVNQTVNVPALSNDVTTGSKIYKFIYAIITAVSVSSAASGVVNWYFAKRRFGQSFGDFPQPSALVDTKVRNQIIKSGLVPYGTEDGGAVYVHRGPLKIPKIYHRNRDGDVQFFAIRPTTDVEISVQICYKEYT